MTKPRDETSTKLYAELWADYAAQCDTVYEGADEQPRETQASEIAEIQEMFKKDPRYALLVKHNFQPPTNTRRVKMSDLDRIVETHGL